MEEIQVLKFETVAARGRGGRGLVLVPGQQMPGVSKICVIEGALNISLHSFNYVAHVKAHGCPKCGVHHPASRKTDIGPSCAVGAGAVAMRCSLSRIFMRAIKTQMLPPSKSLPTSTIHLFRMQPYNRLRTCLPSCCSIRFLSAPAAPSTNSKSNDTNNHSTIPSHSTDVLAPDESEVFLE